MREDEIRRELDEVRPYDVPRPPAVPYYLDEPVPGPDGYDPDWDDLVPHWMRGPYSTGAMYYGFQGQPISMRQWCALHASHDRHLAKTPVVGRHALAEVSTVWLGMNHRFVFDDGGGDPIIFESMVFGGDDLDQDFMRRYSSWQDALAGHAEIVTLVELELVELAADPAGEARQALNDAALRKIAQDIRDEFGFKPLEEDDK